MDSREQLRTAHDMLDTMGIEAFAELTAQEARVEQIVQYDPVAPKRPSA